MSVVFRSCFDLPEHNAQLGGEQRREQRQKEEEGHRDRSAGDFRRRDAHGHQVLDGPRLASDLGDDPAGLRGEVGQRDAPHGRPQQPAFRGEAVAAVEPPDEAQQQDEEAARADHHAERVEQQRHVGHDLLRRREVAVAEVGEMFAQELRALGRRAVELGLDLGDGRRVALLARRAVAAQFLDGHAPPFDLLRGRHHAVLLVAVDQVVDARNERVGRAETHQREHLRNVDPEVEGVAAGPLRLGTQDADGRERRALLPVVERLHGRQLHGLHAGHDGARTVAREGRDEREDEPEGRGDGDAPAGHQLFAPAQQIPRADPHDEQRGEDERRGDGVEELVDRHGRQRHGRERGHLVAHGFEVEVAPHGVLHPRVGDQNPPRREVGTEGREPRGREVETPADLAPAEEHHGDEGRFEEERQNALDGQRRAENVAHEVGVVGPVGPEFEFEDQARGHADGEVDAEQAHPEFGRAEPERVLRADVKGLHDGDEEAQPERQRDEQPVVDGRHGELCARPVDGG